MKSLVGETRANKLYFMIFIFSKIQALECMLDDTFKKSLEIKEEKIHALESR
jgi:hypothetical protein